MGSSPSLALDTFRRKSYAFNATAATVFVLILVLGVLAGETTQAVFAGAGVLLAAFNLVRLRRRGGLEAKPAASGGAGMARRYRIGATVTAFIGLVLVAYGALWVIAGEVEPALVFGVLSAGLVFVVSSMTYATARFVEQIAAAIVPESVRVICVQVREPWRRRRPPTALVLTGDRIAKLQASPSGVTEVGSIAIDDVASMYANFSRGNLTVRGNGAELEVRRAGPVQAYAIFEALREAGVPEVAPDE